MLLSIQHQGGFGLDYGNPAKLFSGWFGVTAFGQWTMQATTYATRLGTLNGSHPRVYGIGPEFVTLQGALTLRYLWEFGARARSRIHLVLAVRVSA